MNKKLFICFMFSCSHLFLMSSDVDSTNELKRLFVRETAFDYCGIDYEKWNTNHVGVTDNQIAYLLERKLSNYEMRCRFQERIEEIEKSAHTSNQLKFNSLMYEALNLLKEIQGASKTDRKTYLVFLKFLERMEYLFVRLAQNKTNQQIILTPQDIFMYFPNFLFEDPPHIIYRNRLSKMKAFRDMIAIGLAINQFFEKNKILPATIKEIPMSEDVFFAKNGMFISYKKQDDVWQLFYSGGSCNDRFLEFNTYIPSIHFENAHKWLYGGCVWYSSDYAKKRLKLYTVGCLNKDSLQWACRMENGIIKE